MFGTKKSSQRLLSNGCPQGCVSSPLLYIIYTNDCHSVTLHWFYVKYADDTAILGLVNHKKHNEHSYFHEINIFQNWCEKNCLELNPSKTKEQIFGPINDENILKVSLHNHGVEIVNNFKHLGLFVNCTLDFDYHVEKFVSKM